MHPGCSIEHVYLCREPIDFRKSINGKCSINPNLFSEA